MQQGITRRQACGHLALGAGALAGAILLAGWARPARASEDTAAALADAQQQYDQVQAQIDQIGAAVEDLSQQLSSTLDAIDAKQTEVDAKQAEVDATTAQVEQTEAQVATLQDQLFATVRDEYEQGNTDMLDILVNSADYEELYRNIYYMGKVSDSTSRLIDQIRAAEEQLKAQQDQLEAEKSQLTDQLAELDGLRDTQQSQLADMQAQQQSAQQLLSGLSDQVAALTDQYNAELVAQAQAAAQASSGAQIWGVTSASAVVSACYSTPSPGLGYCAAWVTNVFQNAGVGYFGGNACDMYASWCTSADRGSLAPGMIIAVSSHNLTSAGRIYGHVGVYVGGGTVMDNVGSIRSIGVDEWIGTYSTTVAARWGWLGGVALS